ncbi:MAG: twin-arginine translocase TatA/TatE family subunit [Bacteroidia bacterium]|nr:twin-arginine translocase TatA/TatE family subunit [Bacteroidia bacterium]
MTSLIIFLFATLGTTELILIAFVLLIFFGGKRIPELMRGLGKSAAEFKKAKDNVEDEVRNLKE